MTSLYRPDERSALLGALGEMLLSDLDVGARLEGRAPTLLGSRADEILSQLDRALEGSKRVYTAFDGDHQMWVPLMRRAVLDEGHIPVNPDSILDYRETLVARRNKEAVLKDDLSLLRKCEELWVFTEVAPDASEVGELAEGVLVELCFFLKRRARAPVYFVSLAELARSGRVVKTAFSASYQDVKKRLPADVGTDVLGVANTEYKTDRQLPLPSYVFMDPLDFKYARFVLPWIYAEEHPSQVPLVPYLAIDVSDRDSSLEGLGEIVLAWAGLVVLAGCAVELPGTEPRRSSSQIQELLRRHCLRDHVLPISDASWQPLGIPKLELGDQWALTERERNESRAQGPLQ